MDFCHKLSEALEDMDPIRFLVGQLHHDKRYEEVREVDILDAQGAVKKVIDFCERRGGDYEDEEGFLVDTDEWKEEWLAPTSILIEPVTKDCFLGIRLQVYPAHSDEIHPSDDDLLGVGWDLDKRSRISHRKYPPIDYNRYSESITKILGDTVQKDSYEDLLRKLVAIERLPYA